MDNVSVLANRVRQAREWMSEREIDGLVLLPGDNFYYFSGCRIESMERLVALVLTADSGTLICPELLVEQCESVSGVNEIRAWGDAEDPYSLIRDLFESNSIRKLGIEGSIPYSTFLRLKQAGIQEIETADRFFSKLRSRKSAQEIESISAAVSKSENAYRNTIKCIEKGISEIEVSEILSQNFKKEGLSSPAFKSIVAFGENSALPHHEPSERKLQSGDLVLIDFGGAYSGYSSDITRTVAFESIDKELLGIYQTVKMAQEQTISSVSRGTRFSEIDSTARKIISDAGFGDLFIHRVGHGLGISVHEEPYLVPDNLEEISEGTVFTVEPGIYIRGRGGVRIEDTLFFDGNKAVSFNSLEKDLIIL